MNRSALDGMTKHGYCIVPYPNGRAVIRSWEALISSSFGGIIIYKAADYRGSTLQTTKESIKELLP